MKQSIYVMQNGKDFKIGISVNPEQRLSSVKCGFPKVKLIWFSEPIEHARKVECDLHKKYKDCCVGGEWFRIKDIDDVIKTISQYAEKSEKQKMSGKAKGRTNKRSEEKALEEQKIRDIVSIALGYKNYKGYQEVMNDLATEIYEVKKENDTIEEFAKFIRSSWKGNSTIASYIFESLLGKSISTIRKENKLTNDVSLMYFLPQDDYDKISAVFHATVSMFEMNYSLKRVMENIKYIATLPIFNCAMGI